MKKVVYLLIIVGLIASFLGACTKNTKDIPKSSIINQQDTIIETDVIEGINPSQLPVDIPENPDLINIYICGYEKRNQMATEVEISFENFIKNTFDYSIDIIYLDMADEHWETELRKTNNDGIIYFYNEHHYDTLMEEEMLIPLNEYASKNAFSHFTYQNGLKIMSDSDGYFYVIPARYNEYYRFKMYNTLVLDQLSLPIPVTIDEFTNLANRIKADGGYVRCYQDHVYSFFDSFSDVFTAFGVHIDRMYGGNISYNPYKEEYVLPILTDEFLNAFTYLKKLKDEDKILPYSSEEMLKDKMIASSSNFLNFEGALEYSLYEQSLFLSGDYDEFLINVESSLSGFAILKGSYNIDGKVSFLMDELFTNEALMLSFLYGRAGYNFNIVDESVIVSLIQGSDGYSLRNEQTSPNFKIDYYENPLPVYYKRWSDGELVPESYGSLDVNYREIYTDNMFYDMDMYVKSEMDDKYLQSLNIAFNKLFTDAFQNNEPIENAIEDYRKTVEKEGLIEYIKMLNEK